MLSANESEIGAERPRETCPQLSQQSAAAERRPHFGQRESVFIGAGASTLLAVTIPPSFSTTLPVRSWLARPESSQHDREAHSHNQQDEQGTGDRIEILSGKASGPMARCQQSEKDQERPAKAARTRPQPAPAG